MFPCKPSQINSADKMHQVPLNQLLCEKQVYSWLTHVPYFEEFSSSRLCNFIYSKQTWLRHHDLDFLTCITETSRVNNQEQVPVSAVQNRLRSSSFHRGLLQQADERSRGGITVHIMQLWIWNSGRPPQGCPEGAIKQIQTFCISGYCHQCTISLR